MKGGENIYDNTKTKAQHLSTIPKSYDERIRVQHKKVVLDTCSGLEVTITGLSPDAYIG